MEAYITAHWVIHKLKDLYFSKFPNYIANCDAVWRDLWTRETLQRLGGVSAGES